MLQASKKIFINANITTLCEELPQAEAICVANGRIEALGSQADIESYVAHMPHEIIDCQGKYLYPGFIDTHSHLTFYSKMINNVFCGSPNKSLEDVLQSLTKKAENTPKGNWVIGYAFDDTGLVGGRHMNRYDLDAVSKEHPVFVFHISSHMGYVNSKAIELIGIDENSSIEGGEYEKDENGIPTGFLIEYAYFESQKKLPDLDDAQVLEGIKEAIKHYNKCGFTTFFDGGLGFGSTASSCAQALLTLERKGELNARGYLQFLADDMKALQKYGLHDFGSDFIKLGGLKHFVDGSIQIFTAALSQPYHTKPDHSGELLFSVESINEIIERFHCQHVQIAVHTNGDQASEVVLSAFEKAYAKYPCKELNHMLIHAQMVSDAQLERMKAINVIPSFFARHVEVWGDRHAQIFLGLDRAARLNPAGSAVALDMPFSLHVDTPVLPVTALGAMHVAVNRTTSGGVLLGAEQRISPLKALEAYTSYAALCCNTRADRGTLAIGHYADFVVLEQDLLTIDPTQIKDIKVCKTICGGNVVYDADKE